MRGAEERRRRRLLASALVGALVAVPTIALVAVPAAPAQADLTSLPGTMSTATQNTSTFTVQVPAGVEVRAITGVLTQSEVVEGGTVTFRINGAQRIQYPSALYQKVRIPVNQPDVIANGTIALTMTTEGPAEVGATCLPSGGVAAMRKLELDYRGVETPPTTPSDFFPASSSGITVVIPEDADEDVITAGLNAVTALTYRYGEDTPVTLALAVPALESTSASARVVSFVAGESDRGDHHGGVRHRDPDPHLHRHRRGAGRRRAHPVQRHPRAHRLPGREPVRGDQVPQHRHHAHPGRPRLRRPLADRLRLELPRVRAAPGLLRRARLLHGPAPRGLAHGLRRRERRPARRTRQRQAGRLHQPRQRGDVRAST